MGQEELPCAYYAVSTLFASLFFTGDEAEVTKLMEKLFNISPM